MKALTFLTLLGFVMVFLLLSGCEYVPEFDDLLKRINPKA